MERFLLRLAINSVALYLAVNIVDGIHAEPNNWLSFVLLALIFGLVNALLKPILTVMSCPLIILTLGLGTLLINTLMFFLAGVIGTNFGVGFTVDGFLPAFLGALVVSVVSFLLSALIGNGKR